MKLKDVATIERAKKVKIYGADCFAIQVSASRGQVINNNGLGEYENRYAVIIPNPDAVVPRFLFHYVKQAMPYHFCKMCTGINLQMDTIESFPVHLPIGES